MNLDQKDKMIISKYAQNPGISQQRIAKEMGLSKPVVATRVRKLKEMGAIKTQTGINPVKMGLYMAKVEISTTQPQLILQMFSNCPYFSNGFTLSGRHNLCLFLVSEDITTLEAWVTYHLRSLDSVIDLSFNMIIDTIKDIIIPPVQLPEDSDIPSCSDNSMCEECPYLKSKRCPGCPAMGKNDRWFR